MGGINLRRQGVYGENLPTKQTLGIRQSDFLIGSIIGVFERAYDKAIVVNNFTEFQTAFGTNFNSAYYGFDCVQGFFQNTSGVEAKLYVKSHVGASDENTIDAVVASKELADTQSTPENVLQLQSAFRETLEYGIGGNRTGYTIERGTRSENEVKTANLATDTFLILSNVSDVFAGDILKIIATGGGGATVYHKVGSVEETTGKVNLVDANGDPVAFNATANAEIGDAVSVLGFKVRTWRKDVNGLVSEVNASLGEKWLSTEIENQSYYVENVFNPNSTWLKVTRLTTAVTSFENIFPAEVSQPVYLENGANGTGISTVDSIRRDVKSFDNLPVRFMAIVETTNEDIQKHLETYGKGRTSDEPKTFFNTPKDQTKTQLLNLGKNYQRSDEVLGYITHEWLEITDPFNTAINAPLRQIPNCGHLMGAYIRSIGVNGVHYSPAVRTNPIRGIKGIVNDNLGEIGDIDRTEILESGVNVIQFIQGSGYILRSFNTPCTQLDYVFCNAGVMKSLIKVSVIDSLQGNHNEPNNFDRIKAGKDAIVTFMLNLATRGSTGNVPEGETFGQQEGQKLLDTFEVQGDAVNNPQSAIQAGERNYDTWFQRPAPTGSLKIGVGIIIPA